MKRSFELIAATTIMAVLGACSVNPGSRGADQAKTDETAIRKVLASIEERINKDDLSFVDVFAADAIIMAPAAPNMVGFDAIRSVYSEALKQNSMQVHFATDEIVVSGDLAYERGNYTLRMTDRASGRVLQDVKNRHIHIFKRQSDGAWKTWRMMTNSEEAAAVQK